MRPDTILCWPKNLDFYLMTRGMGPRPKSCFDRPLVLLYKLCHSTVAVAALLLSCPSLGLGVGKENTERPCTKYSIIEKHSY